MGQILHGSATTTEAIRRAIHNSEESLRALSARYGINQKTVAKWRKRTSVADLPTGPKDAKSTVLTLDEEAIIVAFRRHTLLPLDDRGGWEKLHRLYSQFFAQQWREAAREEKMMGRRPRRNHSPAFKAKMALAAIKGEKTLVELSQEGDVHPQQIMQWRDQLLAGAIGFFGDGSKAVSEPVIDVKTLHAKIGELTLERDFLSGTLGKAGLLASAKR